MPWQVKSVVTIDFLQYNFLFIKADICNSTKSTLEKIDGCPTSNNELQKRIQRKMCQSYVLCRDEELFYHCVKYLDRFAEVCSPKHSIRGNLSLVFI